MRATAGQGDREIPPPTLAHGERIGPFLNQIDTLSSRIQTSRSRSVSAGHR